MPLDASLLPARHRCWRCGKTKTREEFIIVRSRSKSGPGVKFNHCRECNREAARAYYRTKVEASGGAVRLGSVLTQESFVVQTQVMLPLGPLVEWLGSKVNHLTDAQKARLQAAGRRNPPTIELGAADRILHSLGSSHVLAVLYPD